MISHKGGRCQGFQFPSGAAGGLISRDVISVGFDHTAIPNFSHYDFRNTALKINQFPQTLMSTESQLHNGRHAVTQRSHLLVVRVVVRRVKAA